jgi:hypothetical protein
MINVMISERVGRKEKGKIEDLIPWECGDALILMGNGPHRSLRQKKE